MISQVSVIMSFPTFTLRGPYERVRVFFFVILRKGNGRLPLFPSLRNLSRARILAFQSGEFLMEREFAKFKGLTTAEALPRD